VNARRGVVRNRDDEQHGRASSNSRAMRRQRKEWNHVIVPLTQEHLDSTELLKNSILSDKTWETYVTFLVKFVCFVAQPHPEFLTEDLWNKLNTLEISEWKNCIREYLNEKPRPPTSLLKLDQIGSMFENWLNSPSMRKPDGSFFSASTYNSCRSAVVSLFTLFDVPSEHFDAEAKRIIRALKVTRAKSAGEGHVTVKRGKDPLSFENYHQIALTLMKKSSMQGVFTHTVLTTMWNLMSRVENAVSICKSHMQWDEDCLLIFFAHEKTDQTESKPGDPRHIYANPFQPAICPILSLGIYFLVCDITVSETQKVFDGQNQYCRFHKSLKAMLSDENLLGHSVGTFGTHSIRKGSATYTSSGCTTCPPFSAVANRAGWTMPGVASSYIQYESAGDQYVGRTVCGLNPADSSFAVLPPRFRQDYDAEPLLNKLFADYGGATPEMRKVLKMTTASVIYHMEWIRNNLPSDHPIFLSALFRDNFDRPPSEMVECHTWELGDVIKATGIPPHVGIILRVKQMHCSVDSLPEKIGKMLDDRMQQSPDFFGHATADQLKSIVSGAMQEVIASQRQINDVIDQPPVTRECVRYPQFYVNENGNLSRIPPEFHLPKGPIDKCWLCYCCWDKTKDVPPLRSVSGKELDRKLSSSFTKFKKVMKLIEKAAREQNVWEEPTDYQAASNVLKRVKLDNIFATLSRRKRKRRWSQLSWLTLAKELYHKNPVAFEHDDIDEHDELDEHDEENHHNRNRR